MSMTMRSAVAAAPVPDLTLTLVTVPVPEPAPPAWRMPDLLFWWAPREGGEMAGIGVAAEVRARGSERFDEIRRRGEELLARVVSINISGDAPGAPGPRLFGGFSFAPGSADAAPWSDFGDAWFALPRALYTRIDGRAWLSVVVEASSAAAVDQARHELERILAAARAGGASGAPPAVRSIAQLDPAVWRDRVGHIRRIIAGGTCEKIVYARRTDIELAAPIDAATLLGGLDRRHQGCFRFAFRRGGALFAGASPERLVARRGAGVESEALAGSIAESAAQDGTAARALLESRKDRGEQEVVARALVRALAPLCRSLEVPPAPEVRALRDVLHLCTPVRGQLARPVHVLDLAAALHPTPAVGGEPTAPALAWIAEHEAPRGWYGGPVGWFDGSGDGELAVAIRSGLVEGERAYAWAGAGIVAESDPDAEYAETGLKQRALLDALGIEG